MIPLAIVQFLNRGIDLCSVAK